MSQFTASVKRFVILKRFDAFVRIKRALPFHIELLVAFEKPIFLPYMAVVFKDAEGKHRSFLELDPIKSEEIIRAFSQGILTDNLFMKALCSAFQRETYDAFEDWFAWLLQKEEKFPLEITHFLNKKTEKRHKEATSQLNPLGSDNPKVVMLEKFWLAFLAFTWKSELQYGVVEAAAIALCKYYGSLGNYERALYFVGIALQEPRTSIHLKAASHTLHLRLQNQAVPPRLEKFVGFDNGYLRNFVCDMPFKRFDIVETGEVNVCCGHWLPTPVGNIETDSLDNILNSKTAKAIRKTMTDGTYKYCNHLECVHLAQNVIPRRETVNDPIIDTAIAYDDFGVGHVDNMLFAYDQSCNLACPSCRKERIIEKPSQNEEKARIVETKLMPLLSKLKHLEINVAGEVFVSKPSRQILSMISQETCPDLSIDMISNGMLFTEKEWQKFPGIHGKVGGVRISIDGARKGTFEKLRRFAIHEVLLENLGFLQKLRLKKEIGGLTFSFTYQLENFREMEEFVHFSHSFGADKIIFEPLQNVGAFTAEQYLERAVHRADHALFSEFIEMIKRPIFKMVGIQHDFANYEGFGDSDLFLSQDYIPMSSQCRLEGMETRTINNKPVFYATEAHEHHRVMFRDTANYMGSYRFAINITPVNSQFIGIEIHSMNLSDYARLLFDLKSSKIVGEQSVIDRVSDIEIKMISEGTFILYFNFAFYSNSAVILNVFMADSELQSIFAGNKNSGIIINSIRANKMTNAEEWFQQEPKYPLTKAV